jgi:hypothetical protein
MTPEMPKFATEREEADWWYKQREATGQEFVKAANNGVLMVGPSSHTGRLAAARGISPEQLQSELDRKTSSPADPQALPKLPRSA